MSRLLGALSDQGTLSLSVTSICPRVELCPRESPKLVSDAQLTHVLFSSENMTSSSVAKAADGDFVNSVDIVSESDEEQNHSKPQAGTNGRQDSESDDVICHKSIIIAIVLTRFCILTSVRALRGILSKHAEALQGRGALQTSSLS